MPVLLLAYGDPKAKDLLRRAIEARYGLRPPAIESLQLQFNGRARARLGPVSTWVPVEAAAYFHLPKAMRWDFTVKPFGLQIQRGVESFNGETYRSTRGGKPVTVETRTEIVQSLRRRLWTVAALLLTPLGEGFVQLALNADKSFHARNAQLDDTVTVFLRPNHTIEYAQVECLNPDTNRQQKFMLRLSEEQVSINDLMLPAKISAFWDDEPTFEIEPISADSVTVIADEMFTLANEAKA